jgi:hypothetical protein
MDPTDFALRLLVAAGLDLCPDSGSTIRTAARADLGDRE